MSTQENQKIVAGLVVRSTEELFAAYEVVLEVTERPCTGADLVDEIFAGIIDFTGDSMRGTVVLAPSRALLDQSLRGAPCELHDWTEELANQLLGRIKNQLRSFGVEIQVTTPVVVRRQYLAPASRGFRLLQCFAVSPGQVTVWLDAEVQPGVKLLPAPVEAGPSEGETVIF